MTHSHKTEKKASASSAQGVREGMATKGETDMIRGGDAHVFSGNQQAVLETQITLLPPPPPLSPLPLLSPLSPLPPPRPPPSPLSSLPLVS